MKHVKYYKCVFIACVTPDANLCKQNKREEKSEANISLYIVKAKWEIKNHNEL